MRPLRLELEGFTSFRQHTCLDLSELDLFAITGPTGAGKSSLIDAICFALYAQVPRIGDNTSDCISQGLDRMWVRFEFAAGEERLRVFRESKRKGAPNARLERWEDGDWRPVADRAREVTAQVIETVGLDYNGFTRSVLLPQGQFQEFLAGSAEKRRAVLRSLLRLEVYDRMRARAGVIATEMKARLDEREQQIGALADATPENLEQLEGQLTTRRDDRTRLTSEVTALSTGVERALALGRERERLHGAEKESSAAQAEIGNMRGLVEKGDEALADLRAQLTVVQKLLASNQFDAGRLTALTIARERAGALASCVAEIGRVEAEQIRVEAEVAAAGLAAEEAKRRHDSTGAELIAADAARREAELHNLAAALQRGLKPGDPCPVCGGVIGEMAPLTEDGLEAAQRGWESARKAESQARELLHRAQSAVTTATATAKAILQRAEQLAQDRERLETALAEALPDDGARTPAAVEAAIAALTAARAERQALEAESQRLSAEEAGLKGQLEQARQALTALDQRLHSAETALTEAQKGVESAEAELWSLAQAPGWQDALAALKAGGDATQSLKARLSATQVAQSQAEGDIGRMEERLARLQADIERAKALRKELERLKREHAVAYDLAQMLQANRFQSFVQQEALETLAADGSRRLEQLSAGRYRLTVEEKGQDFEVIDQWNADQARSVKTLSGGETFLASLSLSLALAESLPDLAASRRVVLDSIFLDEGFGSLDSEALDRAADALDQLRDENRMVCVVTHLQELAQRLPARVVVTKSETGSSVAVA